MPKQNDSFYKFLAKKRGQIEADAISGERELLEAFNLTEKDRAAVKGFLAFPLENSRHPAALLVSHNSFAVYLAGKDFRLCLRQKQRLKPTINRCSGSFRAIDFFCG